MNDFIPATIDMMVRDHDQIKHSWKKTSGVNQIYCSDHFSIAKNDMTYKVVILKTIIDQTIVSWHISFLGYDATTTQHEYLIPMNNAELNIGQMISVFLDNFYERIAEHRSEADIQYLKQVADHHLTKAIR